MSKPNEAIRSYIAEENEEERALKQIKSYEEERRKASPNLQPRRDNDERKTMQPRRPSAPPLSNSRGVNRPQSMFPSPGPGRGSNGVPPPKRTGAPVARGGSFMMPRTRSETGNQRSSHPQFKSASPARGSSLPRPKTSIPSPSLSNVSIYFFP